MAYEPLSVTRRAGEYSPGVHVVYTKTCKAGEYSPARPLGSSKTWLGSTPWPTTWIYYATNSMAGNSLATMPIFGWGAWVWVVCWVGSVGVAGQPWPVGWCTSPAGLRRDCRRLQHLSPLGLRPPGSSGCCGLRVGSRPGVREGSGGRGGDTARDRRGEEKADGVAVSRNKPRYRERERE